MEDAPNGAMDDATRVASAVSLILGAKNEEDLWQRYAVGSRMFVPVPHYGFDLLEVGTGVLVPGKCWGMSTAFLARWCEVGQQHDVVYTEMLCCGRPVALQDVMDQRTWQQSRAYREMYYLHDITSLLHAPLIAEGRLLGSLSFGTSRAKEISPGDRIAAEALALLVSTVLGRVRGSARATRFGPVPCGGDPQGTESGQGGRMTARETTVARLAAEGMRDREIAEALHMSIHTVKQHLKNGYRKSGVRSRVELARFLQSIDCA